MTFTEIKKRNDKRYYYRVKSIRKGEKVEKQRIYLGANITKEQLAKLEQDADKKIESGNMAPQEKEIKQEKSEEEEKQGKTEGITVEKDEFSEWFTQLMIKTDLTDYTKVSGCIVFKPKAWAIWEKIQEECNKRFKELDIKNVYFPLFIPEEYLNKEQEHVKGFSPEVAWVTHAGDTKLNEKLAIRPTSEAIMYPSFSKWIRSYRDLPLKFNQWSNVVRWEFKHPVPFLRTREFWFNEGHTVYASKQEAEKEKDQIINIYKEICEDYLALPGLIGKKTNKEKFAGADYTISIEYLMPNGKAIQGPDFHHDGQNFAKAYDIKFLDKDEKEQYAWQNTWAISTRMIGVMLAIHADSKGLIIPPRMALNQIVIIPIFFEKDKKKVLDEAEKIKSELKEFSPILDDREEHRPGFKFNEYELKGIPIRIELGSRDLQKNQVIVVRRDTLEKQAIKLSKLKTEIPKILENIQKSLFEKAKKSLNENIVKTDDLNKVKEAIKNKKIIFTPLCNSIKCEDNLKFKTNGAKVLNIPEDKQKDLKNKKCIICNKPADYLAYIGKSY